MVASIKEEIRDLRVDLENANLQNEKLDLEIRLARAKRGIKEKEFELGRLQDPNEPLYPECSNQLCCSHGY